MIDPLFAHMDGEVDTFKDQSVRGALAPLPPLADEMGLAVVAVRHLTKSTGGNPLYRGGGSIGIIGAARMALAFGEDPDDEERLALASNKINIGPTPPTLALRLKQSDEVAEVAEIVWEEGPCELTARDLFGSGSSQQGRASRAVEEAEELLRDVLADGPRRSTEVHEEREERGISKRTFYRAKDNLGVVSKQKPPVKGPYYMHPPHVGGSDDQEAKTNTDCQTPSTHFWQSDQNAQNGDIGGYTAPGCQKRERGNPMGSEHALDATDEGKPGTVDGNNGHTQTSPDPGPQKAHSGSALSGGDRVQTPDGGTAVLDYYEAGRWTCHREGNPTGELRFDPGQIEKIDAV